MILICKQSRQHGFTLVELLVVMAIASIMIALVGGLAIDSHQKFQRKAETLTVKQIFKTASNQAFLLEKNAEITLSVDTIQIFRNGTAILNENFNYVRFSPVNFSLHPTGFYSLSSLSYRVGEQKKMLVLNE